MIEVRLFATFREGRQKIFLLEESQFQFQTVIKVLEHLQIPKEEVAICLINGRHSKLETTLNQGDVLALFPPVGGG